MSQARDSAFTALVLTYVKQSPEGVFVNGVWGPYKDVVFPGWWMNEGGQSSTGQVRLPSDTPCLERKAHRELAHRLHDYDTPSL